MAQELCEICHRRPATTEVTVEENGRRRDMHICDYDYRRLSKRGRSSSPMESLFGNSSLFEEFFGNDFGNFARESDFEQPIARSREAIDLVDYLSEHSKELLHKAAECALSQGRHEVDTEHVLLALTESDVVQAIFKEFKVSADDLKQYLLHNLPESGKKSKGKDATDIDVSPRVKGVLEKAFYVSRELGHSYIGPEHILTGLIEEGEGLAADVLQKYGLTKNALRQKALKVVGKSGAEAGKVTSHTVTPTLDKFSRDLTEYARQGRLDPVIGRAKEIETTIEVLARRKKNNPVLIGEPGVGKTAIVEGLAQRIVQDEVPEVLRNKRLTELNINSMVAGAKYRGELEERTKQVLDEVVAHSNELIVFIDEIHTIVGAGQGGGEGGLDIANVFKPALARGELHLIGATTLSEYQKHIEKDAALERRFQPVYVGEPSVHDTIEILRGLRDRFEAHHKVKITSSAIEAAAKLSDRYIRGRHLPDKAIDLIDQAAARVRINSSSRPAEIHELESRIKKLKQEQESASASKRYDRAREIETRLKESSEQLEKLKLDWKKSVGTSSSEVSPLHVASIVATLTGIPVSDLTTEDRDKLLKLEERLESHVIGQPQAVKSVAQVVKLARTAMREPNHPIATFLFLGPTGVGKTELSKALARELFGDESALIRIDMSEYMERHTVARLIGAPPGYVGYEEGGQLTEKVRRRPYSVVLLDEIEKAHPEVHNVLLQLFDEGRLTDGKGRVVDFTNSMIIATSNIGSDLIQSNMTAGPNERLEYTELKTKLMDVLRRHFRPEMLNRIDEVIVFNALGKEELRGIVRIQLERVKKNVASQGIGLEFKDSLLDHLAEVGFVPEWGARELKRKIRTELETRLADALLKDELKKGDRATIGYDSASGITIETKPAPKEEKPKHVEPRAKKKSPDQARPNHH